MGQFKPMVKMMTTEPSVILKLKKGGKVAHKMDGGYMPMQSSMPAQAAPTMPARGGMAPAASPMKPSMAARRKAMMAKKPPMNASLLMKKGGKADCETVEKELKEHEAMPMKKAHKKATGGVVNGQGGFANGGIIKSTKGETKMVTAKPDKSPAKTGDVKMGNGGGYKKGGLAMVEKNGKMVPHYAADGVGKMKHGGKSMMNGGMMGGYKMGGSIDNDKCWENAPANTAKAGKSGGTTGEVRKGNAGGFKMGGAAKKAYATGGTVDTGKPVAMPQKAASKPVSNNMQSGTFKKGGKVNKFSEGGDASKGAYDKAIGPSDEDMDMAKAIRAVPRKLYEGAKSMMGMGKTEPKAGSVTKTEKSITVAPKKRGGSAC
jgi:hypothetical protein